MKDKRKLAGTDKVNHDELNGIASIESSNETDLIQCQKCHRLHHHSINHSCFDIPYFSWACAICNRETSKWKKVEGDIYMKSVEIRRTVRIWSKPVCEDCIFRLHKELTKHG